MLCYLGRFLGVCAFFFFAFTFKWEMKDLNLNYVLWKNLTNTTKLLSYKAVKVLFRKINRVLYYSL